ncbi:MAG: Ig-like domain-containing protein, partial [Usitatibacter sp.]
WQSEAGGRYALAEGTPGFDQGMRIANFNDDFLGAAPDVGAAESGAPAMRFGLDAAASVPGSAAPIPAPAPSPAPIPPPPGSGPVAMRIDSSSYSVDFGAGVTLTVQLMGGAGQPTGTISFRDNGGAMTGCETVSIAGGEAKCSTSALAVGEHRITGLYSGDRIYGAGIAGVITQIVR